MFSALAPLESIPTSECSLATLLLTVFSWATPPHPPKSFTFICGILCQPRPGNLGGPWGQVSDLAFGKWPKPTVMGSIKLWPLINFNLRFYTISNSLPTPFLKEGEKACQKDEFQNRKITTLIMKPSQLNKELLKVAKWKMSGFCGHMHNY